MKLYSHTLAASPLLFASCPKHGRVSQAGACDECDMIAETGRQWRTLTNENIRFRDALETISKNGCCDTCQEAKLVALQALE